MTSASLLRMTSAHFRVAGIPDPETDSALLLSFLCGKDPLSLRLDTDSELSPEILSGFSALVERRLSREPLQYITGEAPFMKRMFQVDHRVLIPRPETELLCAWALELLPSSGNDSVLDLCCGSGCIGLTIAAERPSLHVTLSDLSGDALDVAALNADRFGVSVTLHRGDLTSGLEQASFNMIVSNPPYIPTLECCTLQPEVLHEPRMALNGGQDGLDFYRRIAAESMLILKKGGRLLMELGYGEAEDVAGLLSDAGFRSILIREDLNGIKRMILAERPDTEETCLID